MARATTHQFHDVLLTLTKQSMGLRKQVQDVWSWGCDTGKDPKVHQLGLANTGWSSASVGCYPESEGLRQALLYTKHIKARGDRLLCGRSRFAS